MNESNDALGGQRVYMTQPSLVEQAREMAKATWTQGYRDSKVRDLLEKLADELERYDTKDRQKTREINLLVPEVKRLTDAVAEMTEALTRIEDYCRARFNVSGYTSDEVMSSILRNYVDPLLAKHRPVASEEDR